MISEKRVSYEILPQGGLFFNLIFEQWTKKKQCEQEHIIFTPPAQLRKLSPLFIDCRTNSLFVVYFVA